MRECKESPCYSCIENDCHGCACAVCETDNECNHVWWYSKSMKAVKQNQADCDKFIGRLWAENEKDELVLGQNWRGFPVGVFTQDD